ncbi:hypothetical protein [Streptomyces halstedii]|uniref:hypothetical protein n=1 Tax=Streptomyces halstedii TaxID=1944 RepID=UPI0033BB07E1
MPRPEQAAKTTVRALQLVTGVASVRPRRRIATQLNRLRPHAGSGSVRDLLEHAYG